MTELRPRGAAWTRELRLRPLPGQQVFTIDAMRLLVDRLQDLLAIRLPFLAKVSFQILLTRPAVNDEDEDEDQVELTHYFLRLAPWIVRPTSPSARAGTMMAAIRTKFEVALERSRFPESDWTVVGITAAYLLTAPSQQLARPRRPTRREAAGRSCPRPWPRRRPSGTLRTRITAASCGASSRTAWGSTSSTSSSGQGPRAARAPSSTPSWPAAEDRAPRASQRNPAPAQPRPGSLGVGVEVRERGLGSQPVERLRPEIVLKPSRLRAEIG